MIGARMVVPLLLAGVAAGCGNLTEEFVGWSVEIVEPLENNEVVYCAVSGGAGLVDRFVPDVNVVAAFTAQDEDIYTFNSLGIGSPFNGGVSAAMNELFGGQMTFDLGPLGTAYDDVGPVQLNIGLQTVTRTLISGSRKADDEVELRYEFVPDCTEVTLAAGGTCECASETMTWRFTGAQ